VRNEILIRYYGTSEKRENLALIEKKVLSTRGSDAQKEILLQKILLDFSIFIYVGLSYQQSLNLKTAVKKIFLATQKEDLVERIFAITKEEKVEIKKEFDGAIVSSIVAQIHKKMYSIPPRGVDSIAHIIYCKIAILAVTGGLKPSEIFGDFSPTKGGVLSLPDTKKYLKEVREYFKNNSSENYEVGVRKAVARLNIAGCKNVMDFVKIYRASYKEVTNA